MKASGDGIAEVQPGRPTQLKFEIGARTLMVVQRLLVRVPLSLNDAHTGRLPVLPVLAPDVHGYSVTSLPAQLEAGIVAATGGMLPLIRQRYTRYWADLTGSYDGWLAGLSSNTRQQLRRKAKRIAQENGGVLDVRRFRSAGEMEAFHDVARRISLRTYQEKLLGSGLPDTPEFMAAMATQAAADKVRAWLLYLAGEPAAYLYCPIEGDTVIYAYVGHDPAFNDLSPGAVLQLEAMRDLFAEERYARFDFTEGEGQHKRQMSTGGIACVDMLLLRPSLGNRVTMAALGGFNAAVALVKSGVQSAGMGKFARKLRRGA